MNTIYKRYLSIAAVIAAVIMAGIIAWPANHQTIQSPSKTTQATTTTIRFVFDQNLITSFPNIKPVANEDLFTITQRVTKEHNIAFDFKAYPSMGNLITQIGEKKNGVNNMYWQYSVNGTYAVVAADKYIVKSGDLIEWKFSGYEQTK